MGKKTKKTAKGRLDKYYHLAKDQGYRARSAFKLIQLNKKYNFLEKSKCLIDLCAAPGSWLQVANKYMPSASLIIGVDLVSIKPISNVITFQEDITSEKCRSRLRNELKNWKADVILHDGAPNVGISWLQDAFSQSELTLKALRLAVEFLNKGGTFLTKIFRSKDYNNLIWIFKQLFGKVEATKPASSRNVSAEIFVVCRDYLAPKKIDPKFLDPRSVFQDIDVGSTNKSIDILHPEKKRRNRDGYEDGEYLLYKEIPISEFINSDDPIKILGSASKLKFDDKIKELLNHELTTEEIKACCEDLKVLSRKEFKSLLKWRSAFRKPKSDNNEINVKTEMKIDEKQDIQEELYKLTEDERIRHKRLRKKANEKRQKNITRMQLKMISPTDIALDNEGGALKKIRKGDMNVILDQGDNQDDDIVIDIQNKDHQNGHVVSDDITYLEEELDEL
ncbi:2393_t:CDS:10 [Diversispora eburnea]|uniref:2393_t:CDS:1 n=1 Tax=Diversispora eburnea TaxID=1213867 RepID=A0A9N8ZC36_9GLOM|nr:2393_t:CDS:10 [Diversispora eburnea]